MKNLIAWCVIIVKVVTFVANVDLNIGGTIMREKNKIIKISKLFRDFEKLGLE